VSLRSEGRVKAIEDNGAMIPLHVQLQNSTLCGVIKRLRFPLDITLVWLR
jgi:hypothetical protein